VARVFRKGRDGIYYAWGFLADGTRWTKSTGKRKKREADREAVELERDAQRRADEAAHQAASLGWAVAALLQSFRAGGKADSTIASVRVKGGHLVRVLGSDLDVRELEPPHGIDRIAKYVADRVDEGAARSTVAVEVGVLRMALRVAARAGKYRGDTRALSIHELRGAHKPRKRWLTADEARALVKATPPQWRDHVEMYIGTGARRRELYRVTAADVDLAGNRLHIRGTKTASSDRWVPMAPRVREIVVARMKDRPTGQLLPTWTRVHLDLPDICATADIERCSASDLRRTFASMLLSEGVAPGVLKELLGHSTTKMIDLVYGHASEAARQAAVLKHPTAKRAKRRGSRAEADSTARGSTKGTKGTGKRKPRR
jgi:integrase